MFEVGFSELLLICVIALLVLGPQKLPKLASQVGRWMGRARSMARQFREQLEEESLLEETKMTAAAKPATAVVPTAAEPNTQTTGVPPDDDFAHHEPEQQTDSVTAEPVTAATDHGDLPTQTARADEPAKE
jgi:sec-independent protein translocase protein TatB